MRTDLARTAGILATALLMSGCASTYSAATGPIDPANFGEANRQTYAAMIVNPDPQYDAPMTSSAEQAAVAIERYRTDTVKQPEAALSTEGISD